MLLPCLQLSLNREIKKAGGVTAWADSTELSPVLTLVHALASVKVQDKQIWSVVVKYFLQKLDSK